MRQLVLDLDNGPENSGQRSQWLWRLVLLAQKYSGGGAGVLPAVSQQVQPDRASVGDPGELLAGELLDSEAAVLGYAGNMTYNGVHPQVIGHPTVRQGGEAEQGGEKAAGRMAAAETGAGEVGD